MRFVVVSSDIPLSYVNHLWVHVSEQLFNKTMILLCIFGVLMHSSNLYISVSNRDTNVARARQHAARHG